MTVVHTKIGEEPDPVERFFAYAIEREAIRIRREVLRLPRYLMECGRPIHGWTDDPILQKYRFCNVHREDDAVTRWFRTHVREPLRAQPEVLLATVLFRWFCRITTGEAIFSQTCLYADDVGTAWEEFLRTGKVAVLRAAIKQYCGAGPYVTGSYIVQGKPGMPKLEGVLWYVDAFVKEDDHVANWRYVAEHMLNGGGSLEECWGWLREHKGLGDFMAYEIVTDLRHTDLLCKASDIVTWANPGPGAMRGLYILEDRPWHTVISKEAACEEMRKLLKISRIMWPKEIEGVATRPWELREVEHTLCEMFKYEKTRLGKGRPRGVMK